MNSQKPKIRDNKRGSFIRKPIIAAALVCLLAMQNKADVFDMRLYAKEPSCDAPITHIANDEKKIALTFDDGPDVRYTPEILDILSEYNVKATFFVIGSNCELYPDLVLRELKEGHEIGNHTYSHPRLTKISAGRLVNEIIETENVLFEICEYHPKLFRPPEGIYSNTVKRVIKRLDYIPVVWSVDTLDWKGSSADSIVKTVMSNPKSGMIILCHDYISHNGCTPKALRSFIPKLQKQGYEFVTVSELLLNCKDSEIQKQLTSD